VTIVGNRGGKIKKNRPGMKKKPWGEGKRPLTSQIQKEESSSGMQRKALVKKGLEKARKAWEKKGVTGSKGRRAKNL